MEPHPRVKTGHVDRMRITLITDEEIEKISSVCITSRKPLKQPVDASGQAVGKKQPDPDGFISLKMGSFAPGQRCQTCNKTFHDCYVHLGYFSLGEAKVWMTGCSDHVIALLHCFCTHCQMPLLDAPANKIHENKLIKREQKKLVGLRQQYLTCMMLENPMARFKFVSKLSRQVPTCTHCGERQNTYRRAENRLETADFGTLVRTKSSQAHLWAWQQPAVVEKYLRDLCASPYRIRWMERVGLNPTVSPPWAIVHSRLLSIAPQFCPPFRNATGEVDLDPVHTQCQRMLIRSKTLTKRILKRRAGEPDAFVRSIEEEQAYDLQTPYDELTTSCRQKNRIGNRRGGYYNKRGGSGGGSGRGGGRKIGGRTSLASNFKSFKLRIEGKEGKLRGHCGGKRVDLCARGVIQGNPDLATDEIGVPRKYIRQLTEPILAASEALVDELNEDLRAGRVLSIDTGGQERIVPPLPATPAPSRTAFQDLERRSVRRTPVSRPSAITAFHNKIQLGDVVHRQIRNGKPLLFLRNPALQDANMCVYKLRIVEDESSGLQVHASQADKFHFDFDGDTLTLFVPQGEVADAEAMELLGSWHKTVSSQDGTNLASLKQGAIFGLHLLTSSTTRLTRREMNDMIGSVVQSRTYNDPMVLALPEPQFPGSSNSAGNSVDGPDDQWTGQQLVDLLVPDVIADYMNASGSVHIRNGRWVKGQADNSVFGVHSSSLITYLAQYYHYEHHVRLLRQFFKLGCVFLTMRGVSHGHGDLDRHGRAVHERKEKLIDAAVREARQSPPANTERIMQKLNLDMDRLWKSHIQSPHWQTPTELQIASGSKGSLDTLKQIMFCIGRQPGNCERDRWAPHFFDQDPSPIANSLLTESFLTGCTEFGMHRIGSVGLKDVAEKADSVPTAGTMLRNFSHVGEDNKVCHDRTTRCDDCITVYGGDLTNPAFCRQVPMSQIYAPGETRPPTAVAEVVNLGLSMPELIRIAHATRLRQQQQQPQIETKESKDSPSPSIDHLKAVAARLAMLLDVPDELCSEADRIRLVLDPSKEVPPSIVQYIDQWTKNLAIFTKKHIQRVLGEQIGWPATVPLEISKKELTFLVTAVFAKFRKSRVQFGADVGMLAAAALLRRLVQLGLDAIHSSGAQNKIPGSRHLAHAKEILCCSKCLTTPLIHAYLNLLPEYPESFTDEEIELFAGTEELGMSLADRTQQLIDRWQRQRLSDVGTLLDVVSLSEDHVWGRRDAYWFAMHELKSGSTSTSRNLGPIALRLEMPSSVPTHRRMLLVRRLCTYLVESGEFDPCQPIIQSSDETIPEHLQPTVPFVCYIRWTDDPDMPHADIRRYLSGQLDDLLHTVLGGWKDCDQVVATLQPTVDCLVDWNDQKQIVVLRLVSSKPLTTPNTRTLAEELVQLSDPRTDDWTKSRPVTDILDHSGWGAAPPPTPQLSRDAIQWERSVASAMAMWILVNVCAGHREIWARVEKAHVEKLEENKEYSQQFSDIGRYLVQDAIRRAKHVSSWLQARGQVPATEQWLIDGKPVVGQGGQTTLATIHIRSSDVQKTKRWLVYRRHQIAWYAQVDWKAPDCPPDKGPVLVLVGTPKNKSLTPSKFEHLGQVMQTPGIDFRHCESNNVHDVFKELGIEAAYCMLYRELHSVMSHSNDKNPPDSRAMILCCNLMTRNGTPSPLTSSSAMLENAGTLKLAIFERASAVLFAHSFHGRSSQLNDTASCGIIGKPLPVGTGATELLMDIDYLRKHALRKALVSDVFRGHVAPDHRPLMRKLDPVSTSATEDDTDYYRPGERYPPPIPTSTDRSFTAASGGRTALYDPEAPGYTPSEMPHTTDTRMHEVKDRKADLKIDLKIDLKTAFKPAFKTDEKSMKSNSTTTSSSSSALYDPEAPAYMPLATDSRMREVKLDGNRLGGKEKAPLTFEQIFPQLSFKTLSFEPPPLMQPIVATTPFQPTAPPTSALGRLVLNVLSSVQKSDAMDTSSPDTVLRPREPSGHPAAKVQRMT